MLVALDRPLTLAEKIHIVAPRVAKRALPIALDTFTAQSLQQLGAHPDDDPRLLFEVWCLNRDQKPIDPVTFDPLRFAHVTELMDLSPAFQSILSDPVKRAHYAEHDASTLRLWRQISRLARTYWAQFAIDGAVQRNTKLWGFTQDDEDAYVSHQFDMLIHFLQSQYPQDRKVYQWSAPPEPAHADQTRRTAPMPSPS